jgi:hypothetical protein
MKYLLIISILITYPVNAQGTFDIDEETTYLDGMYTGAISLDMKASKEEAKIAWKKYIHDEYGINIKRYGLFKKRDKLISDPIAMNFLSKKELTLNTEFIGDSENTIMNLYVLKENGTSLSKSSDSMVISNLEVLAEEFVANFLPDYYKERVDKANEDYDIAVAKLKGLNNIIGEKLLEIEELRIKKISTTNNVGSTNNSLIKKTKVYEKVKRNTAKLN